MAYTVLFSHEFKRDYKKLSAITRELFKIKGPLLEKNPFHPFLKTHKLTGNLAGQWACSIDYKNRVIFLFTNSKTILLLRVGDHGVYKKR